MKIAVTPMQNVFHIGFPKAGSSYLQQHVFPNITEYKYLGLKYIRSQHQSDRSVCLDSLELFYDELLKSDSLRFDDASLKQMLTGPLLQSQELPLFFSHEAAISVFFSHPDATVKADRILGVLGKSTKIIIVIREQKALLASQYRDHPFEPHNIHSGRFLSFEQWCESLEKQRYNSFSALLHFDNLYKIYKDRFGASNVLIMPMELMKTCPDTYSKRLALFLGTNKSSILYGMGKPPINQGHSELRNKLRRLERSAPTTHAILRQIVPEWGVKWVQRASKTIPTQSITIPPPLSQHLDRLYSTSNKNLAKEIGIDLGSIGYSC